MDRGIDPRRWDKPGGGRVLYGCIHYLHRTKKLKKNMLELNDGGFS